MSKKTEHRSFYYRGGQFNDEQEFLDYAKEYNRSTVTSDSISEILDYMVKTLALNNDINPSSNTNAQFQEKVSEITIDLLLWLKNAPSDR